MSAWSKVCFDAPPTTDEPENGNWITKEGKWEYQRWLKEKNAMHSVEEDWKDGIPLETMLCSMRSWLRKEEARDVLTRRAKEALEAFSVGCAGKEREIIRDEVKKVYRDIGRLFNVERMEAVDYLRGVVQRKLGHSV
jgi:hypothetical protein